MRRRPPRSTRVRSSAASDVYKRQEYLDVTLAGEDTWSHATPPGRTVFAYAVTGDTFFGDAGSEQILPALSTALFEDGKMVAARAAAGKSRFLLVSGRPLREPVAWGGPIVMNTDAELREAFDDYRNGTFVRHAEPGGHPRGAS